MRHSKVTITTVAMLLLVTLSQAHVIDDRAATEATARAKEVCLTLHIVLQLSRDHLCLLHKLLHHHRQCQECGVCLLTE